VRRVAKTLNKSSNRSPVTVLDGDSPVAGERAIGAVATDEIAPNGR
jgi:hypothetical protein